MKNILAIRSSATGAASVSNRLIDHFLKVAAEQAPEAAIVERDLDKQPVPALQAETVAAIGRPGPDGEAASAARALSDILIAEVREADVIVIAAPLYNFGMPATLKAWFDLVLRAGETFSYGEAGPVGLIADKPVFVISTSGGVYSEGDYAPFDFREPHVRSLLGFIGLKRVEFIRAEGLAFGEPDKVVEAACAKIDAEVAALLAPVA